jgi:hypothetical protein
MGDLQAGRQFCTHTVLLAAVFNLLGALLVGAAVANTIAGIVTVLPGHAVAVIGSGALSLDPPWGYVRLSLLGRRERPWRRAWLLVGLPGSD